MPEPQPPRVDEFLFEALRLPLARSEIYLLTARLGSGRRVEWDFMSLPAHIVTMVPRFLRATCRELRRDRAEFADVVGYAVAHPTTGDVVAIDRYGTIGRIKLAAPDKAVDAALHAMMRTAPGLIGTPSRRWRRTATAA